MWQGGRAQGTGSECYPQHWPGPNRHVESPTALSWFMYRSSVAMSRIPRQVLEIHPDPEEARLRGRREGAGADYMGCSSTGRGNPEGKPNGCLAGWGTFLAKGCWEIYSIILGPHNISN